MNAFESTIIKMIGRLEQEIEDKKQQRFEGKSGLETEVLTAEIEVMSKILIDLQFDMIANIYATDE